MTTGLTDHRQIGELAADDGGHRFIETRLSRDRIAGRDERETFERQAPDVEIDEFQCAADRAARRCVLAGTDRIVRTEQGGHAIALEVWAMPQRAVGSFLALIPAPLGLGSIELADGRFVHGFLCESHALAQAPDVSHHGGWRACLASLR